MTRAELGTEPSLPGKITPRQAWKHGWLDGYHNREWCQHHDDPSPAVREAYKWGFWNGAKLRGQEING